jgi:hypothetical protein
MNAFLRISRHRQPRSSYASSLLLIVTFAVFGLLAGLAIEHERVRSTATAQTPAPMQIDQHGDRMAVIRLIRSL